MASIHQRNRMVVFRVSLSEYQHLKSACVAAGGRSLSEFTRSELLAAVDAESRGPFLERKFGEIDRRLADLHALVQSVSERIPAPELSAARDDNHSGRD